MYGHIETVAKYVSIKLPAKCYDLQARISGRARRLSQTWFWFCLTVVA